MEWAAATRSSWQRERRLRTVAIFARHARAEDARHEVPPIFVFGHRHVRPAPHIYSADEVRRLLDAAARLAPTWPLRPQVFVTLFSLLAATGLRVSEALDLRFGDVTADGLIIRKTKFNKTRLVPLHPTVTAALDRYLDIRRRKRSASDHVFISPKGGTLPYGTVSTWFLRLSRDAGLRGVPGTKGPRLHDLRHTLAVRALEAAPIGTSPVGRTSARSRPTSGTPMLPTRAGTCTRRRSSCAASPMLASGSSKEPRHDAHCLAHHRLSAEAAGGREAGEPPYL
jgi:integrase